VGLSDHPKNWPMCLAAFAVVYWTTYWLSDVFRLPETGSTPWNPEAGLAVFALLVMGRWALLMLIALQFLCLAIWAPFSNLFWTAVLVSGHMTALAAATELLKKHLLALRVPTANTAAKFVIGALAITTASSLTQMLIASLATDWSALKLVRFGMTISVGNMIGIVTVTPLLLHSPRFQNVRNFFARAQPAGFALIAILLLTCAFVFGLPGLDQFKFFYLTFLPVIAMAMRDGAAGAMLASLIGSAAMIAILGMRDFNASAVTELQFLMITLSATGLVLGATIDERRQLHADSLSYLARLKESEDALMQASRISLASEMVATVSHELSQPLFAARNHIRAIKRRIGKPGKDSGSNQSDIDAAVMQIDSAATTIRNMREFIGRGESRKSLFNPLPMIETVCELMKHEMQQNSIDMQFKASPLPDVFGNRSQVMQVVLNLVRNAKEAIVDAPSPVRKVDITACASNRPGFIEICVSDSGPGVEVSLLPNLFSPLRSTKTEGLGLGLSLSSSIVIAHGGMIWHEAGIGTGAKFCFSLPVADRAES
jgi:two-component system sensor kinase FixL